MSKIFDFLIDSLKDPITSSTEESLKDLTEINAILTEIGKTSHLTKEQLDSLGDASFETASKYGQKAADYLSEVQNMYDAGYKNAEQMAELSLLAQNTGNLGADLAKEYIAASDAAYQYSGNIEKLTALLDAQKQVADRNSLSMEELTNATNASASQLSSFGISENEITALFGTGITSTQNSGEDVGHAVNSIIMRLQNKKGETGFENEVLDEQSLSRAEERCKSLGIELAVVKDGMTSLRDPMEILKELAAVYNSLPDGSAQKAGILSDIGGTYSSDVLSGLLSNWELYEKMLGDFEHADGSAMKDSLATADSWEGALNRLSNTWTDTVENIADSDAVVAGMNSLNGLLDIINRLTSALGSFGSISLGAGLFAGFKNVGSPKMFGLIIV